MRRHYSPRAVTPRGHPRAVLLECGCTVTYPESPPQPGEQVTCVRCGKETRAARKGEKEP